MKEYKNRDRALWHLARSFPSYEALMEMLKDEETHPYGGEWLQNLRERSNAVDYTHHIPSYLLKLQIPTTTI